MFNIGFLNWNVGTVTLGSAGPDQLQFCAPYIYLSATVYADRISSLMSHTYVWQQIYPASYVTWIPSTGTAYSSTPTMTINRLSAPTAIGTPYSTGGSLMPGNYYAKIVAVDAGGGTTTGGTEATATIALTGSSYTMGSAINTVTSENTGVAFDSTQNAVWTIGLLSQTIQKIDAVTGTSIGVYSTASIYSAQFIAYDSIQNAIWVASDLSTTILKYNAVNGNLVGSYTIASATNLVNLIYEPTQNALWAVSNNTTLLKISAATGTLIGSYPIGVITNINGITYDSTHNAIWVGCSSVNTIQKFDAATGAVIGSYSTNVAPYYLTQPTAMTFDATQNVVWVLYYNSTMAQKFDATTGAPLTAFATLTANPSNIVYDSYHNVVYITNTSGTRSVTAYNAATNAQVGTAPTNDIPSGLAYDSINHRAWAVGQFPDNIKSVTYAVTPTTGSIGWTWPAVTNATSYQVWVATTSGNETSYFSTLTNSFTQTTTTGTTGTIPATNTSFAGSATLTATFDRTTLSPAIGYGTFRFWIDQGSPTAQYADMRVEVTPIDTLTAGTFTAPATAAVGFSNVPFTNTGFNAGAVAFRGVNSMVPGGVHYLTTQPPVNSSNYTAAPALQLLLPSAGTTNLADMRLLQNTDGTYRTVAYFDANTTAGWTNQMIANNLLTTATYRVAADYNNHGVQTTELLDIGYTSPTGVGISRSDTAGVAISSVGNASATNGTSYAVSTNTTYYSKNTVNQTDTSNNIITAVSYTTGATSSVSSKSTVLYTKFILNNNNLLDTANNSINTSNTLPAIVSTTSTTVMSTPTVGGSTTYTTTARIDSGNWSSTTVTLGHTAI